MTINLRIRAFPFAPRDFKIFSICSNGSEVLASPEYQSILYNLENGYLLHRFPDPAYTMCLQTLVPRLSNPVFSLEFPQYGCRYVLESSYGVSQFFFEPINRSLSEFKSSNVVGPTKFDPYCSEFFSGKLEPLPWALFDLFSYLYPYTWSSICGNTSAHGHYMVNIFFGVEGQSVFDMLFDKSISCCICDETPLRSVFEMFSREKLRPGFTLGQIVYSDDRDTTISRYLLKPYTYEQAWITGAKLKDLGWTTTVANELHLWSSVSWLHSDVLVEYPFSGTPLSAWV